MHAVNKPEVMVSYAREKFDANGRVADEKTRRSIEDLLESLLALTVRMAERRTGSVR